MHGLDFSSHFLSIRDIWMLGTVIGCCLIMLDDIFIDLLTMFSNSSPHKIDDIEFKKMNSIPEKKIAILIANWHEDAVLERMVSGNIGNINYKNYEFLLGVYPNDTLTLEAARKLERRFKNVRVIVNSLDGPTSKGQMLNRMVYYIDHFNKYSPGNAYDLIVIQDAEDIIHKYALKLLNMRSDHYDFIQIPVFSLPVPVSQFTAGIYIDEFTESHTKNLLVRNSYNAGVPSAGVGTAVTRELMTRLLKLQNGQFLNENTLTEDYFLGLTCYDLNVKAHFSCDYFEYFDNKVNKLKKEYIATRELFPQKVKASIKQKTRWTLGICLQGLEFKRPRSSRFFGKYFLWRDRKGLFNAPLFLSSVLFTVYYLEVHFITGRWPTLNYAPLESVFMAFLWGNLFLSLFRIAQRVYLVNRVYNAHMAALVPLRWVLSNYINTMAMMNAIHQWLRSKITGKALTWSKTDHVVPVGFGESLDFNEDIAPKRIPLVPLPKPVEISQNEAQL